MTSATFNFARMSAVCAAIVFGAVPAFAVDALGEAEFRQALRDVGTDLRFMCVAAHPDDEDGATLATYRYEFGYKTFAVIATRGEGGQNEIGPELYNELAVIRTREMEAAAVVEGAELHFLNLPEFGYSKSIEETYALWGQDTALRRMVHAIRLTRPDVIVTNHGPRGGHGHHQAVGEALQQAFKAAADPSMFPEQLVDGVEPWQAARLYVRAFSGSDNAARVDAYLMNPWLGLTYAEIAARALEHHQSQGMQFIIERYRDRTIQPAYDLVLEADGGVQGGGNIPAPGGQLFEGLQDRVSEEERALSHAADDRADMIKPLIGLAGAVSGETEADARVARLHRAAALAAQIRLDVDLADTELIRGQQTAVAVKLWDFGSPQVSSVQFSLEPSAWVGESTPAASTASMDDSRRVEAKLDLAVPETAPLTVPHADHVFDDGFWQPQFELLAQVETADGPIVLHHPIQFDVAPPVVIDSVGDPYLVLSGKDTKIQYDILLTNHANGPSSGNLLAKAPAGLRIAESSIPFSLAAEGQQRVIPVVAELEGDAAASQKDFVLELAIEGQDETGEALARMMDLTIPDGLNVGVIQSYDDTFVRTLEKMHVPHALLTIEDFTPDRLDTYTAIIVDIRAYLVRPDLIANNQALLDYVERGGNLIVNYQKTFEWQPEFAPYPLRVSRGRVTREDAPITLLQPEHPLFNIPNKIEPGDWDGWVQERGLYFPSEWDAAYTPLIASSDPGEEALEGSCLIADYGEGTYFYTALVWYRQIGELHPGAMKVFANMLALGQSGVPDAD